MLDAAAFQQLDDASLGVLGSLQQLAKGIGTVQSGFLDASKATDRFVAEGKRLSALASGGFFGLIGGVGILLSVQQGIEGVEKAAKSLRAFRGVDKGLTLTESITGTSELTKNFNILDKTSSNVLDNIKTALRATFDPETTRQWASEAVKAYAEVEQAAYRLNTITNQSGQRSIDRLNETISATRRLQEETNFVVSSVELLNTQYNVASGGFISESDQLAVTGAGLNLSQAGFGDIEGSTDGVIRALRALGEGATEAETRAAQLFETTKIGLLTLDELSGDVGGLASQAATLGISFEDVLAAVASLTTQGLSSAEAATRISSLLSDLAANNEQAQAALTGFADAEGRQVQIGAGVLRDKGLTQLIEDLGSATGGQLPNIQRLFSNQMSQEALAGLLNAGTSQLEGFSSQLQNVDTEAFQEEGQNRQRTISGAIQTGQVRAQAQLEQFGAGFSPEALLQLTAINKELEDISLGAAEASGQIIGFSQGIQRKISGAIGVISAVLGTIVPTVLFSFVIKKIGDVFNFLKQRIADGKKDGETLFQFFEREIRTAIKGTLDKIKPTVDNLWEKAKQNFRDFLAEVIPGLKAVETAAQAVSNSFNPNGATPSSEDTFDNRRALPASNVIDTTATVIDAVAEVVPSSSSTSALATIPSASTTGAIVSTSASVASAAAPAATAAASMNKFSAATAAVAKTASNAKGAILGFITSAFAPIIAAPGVLGKVGVAIAGVKTALAGLITGGLKIIAPLVTKILAVIGTAVLAGIVLVAAIKVIIGAFQFLRAAADKQANPAIKALTEQMTALADSTDIESIRQMADELSGLSNSADESAGALERLGRFVRDLGGQLKGGINIATFQASLFNQAQEERNKVASLLEQELSNELGATANTSFTADTEEERQVKVRLETGGILNSDDIALINKDIDDQVALAEELLNQRRASLEDFQARGSGNLEELAVYEQQVESAERELRTVQQISEERKAQIAVLNQIRTAESFQNGVPLNVQITNNLRKQVDAEIEYLATNFSEAFSGESIDPESFNTLVPNLQRALGAIQLQAQVDPQSAIESLNQLQKIPNFDTLIFSDPNFRASFSEAFAKATEAALKEAKSIEAIYTSTFNAISQVAGKSNLALLQETQEAQLQSINSQINILQEELNAAGTPLQRQLELLAQISELEASRISATKQLRDAQFEVAQSQLEQVKGIENAVKSLSGAFSSLGQSTAIGSALNAAASQLNTAPRQIQLDTNRQISDVDFEIESLREQRDAARARLANAEGLTRDQRRQLSGQVTGLDRALNEAQGSRGTRVENIRQTAGLQLLTSELERFQTQVTAASDTLQKTADSLKNTLQFIQRMNQDASANNESIIGLRQSITGFFGNSPMSELLNQRFEVQGIENTRQLQRSEAVNTAQQELIDLAVLDAQLQLEQKGYENALVQTQLLAGVIDALRGRAPSTDNQASVQNFLQGIPDLIAQQSGFIDQRRALNQSQMEYLPRQLENQLLNIERTAASSRLSTLGGSNLNAGNIDLITSSLQSAIQLNNSSQFRQINEGSLNSPEFSNMLNSLNESTRSLIGQDLSALSQLNRAAAPSPQYSIGGGEGLSRPTVQAAPITVSPSIQVTIEGSGGRDSSNIEQLVRTQVSQGLNAATSQIINEVRKL